MKITRELLRKWSACYDDAKIATLVPETGLTPLEIAALDIPAGDRLWVLLREDLIPERELRLLACGWAEAACLKTDWNDARSLAAIAVARRFACGEAAAAEAEAAARSAWSAARSAWSAARAAWAAASAAESDRVEAAAAWSASRSAALASAAEAAAWTAGAAARSAAEAAAWTAGAAAPTAAVAESDRAAARAEQLADVVKTLQEV